MKKGRFLWSAHRITERQKAGKARNIKGKQLKNSAVRSQGSSSRASVQQEIIFGTRIYVQILVLQGFVELSDVVKSGGIYSVRNAFATRLQQKYLKNIGHFSVIGTGECPFLLCRFCIGNYDVFIF